MKKENVVKQSSTFFIKEDYVEADVIECVAKVRLTVNYADRTFDIKPIQGDWFKFQRNQDQATMWKAVASCIFKATEFAEKELAIA